MQYQVMIEKTHWVIVEADSEDEAFALAEDLVPTFSSQFEDTEMSIMQSLESK